jgi:CubicO group peptidase (beta-lactamase class C family)
MYRLVVFVTVLMLAIPTASQCQQRSRASARAVPDSALVRELAELLRGTARLPGLSIAAMRDDRVAFAAGFGTRALGGDTRVDTATQFGAASLSKVVTATAALLIH